MLIRRLARPMLAGIFISGGIDALRHPEQKAAIASDPIEGAAEKFEVETPETEALVKVNAGAMIGAGLLLSAGKAPRLSSIVLAATLVPTTLAGHRFWEETDPQKRSQQQIHFLKNVSLLGGLILAAVDTEGRPDLAWVARRAGHKLAEAAPSLPGSG